MRKNGIPVFGPGENRPTDAPTVTKEQADAARKACEPLLPKDAMQGGGGGVPEELKQSMLAVAQCMRDKGHEFPDPDFSGGRIRMSAPDMSGPNADQANKDNAECQKKAGLNANGGGFSVSK